MSKTEIKYKTAWRIGGWSCEAIKGKAITLKVIDSWERNIALFVEDGKEIPVILEASKVVYSLEEAINGKTMDIQDMLHYYEKQIKEYKDKIEKIKKLK